MSTYPIDLSFISYRAFQEGDASEDQNIPNQNEGSSTYPIDLSAIKYRAKAIGDDEEES